MASSSERIATNEPGASEVGSPRSLESNSDIADDLRDLVRLAHDSYLPPSRDIDEDVRVSKYAKVQHILANPVAQRRVINLGDNDAEAVLDLLQEWLDWAPVDHSERRRVIRVLVKLSISSTKIPRLLCVSNIILTSRDSWKSGGFADILKATCNDTAVVLKRLRVPCADGHYPDLHRKLRREALVWRQLKHQFILPLIGIDATTFANTLPCLVSPWMRQGTLKEYLHSTYYTASRDFYRLMLEAAEGLAYLHSQEVVHGDIKDVNILISDDYHVQLCDFGLVVVGNMTDDGWTTTAQATGTIRWMSPQRLDSMHTSYRINETDDVYALGCLYYYLSTAHAPFHDLNAFKAQSKIMVDQRPSRPTGGNVRTLITDDLWSIVELCWAPEAAIRPKIASVVSQLTVIKLAADAKRERDIDVAYAYDLSEHLIQRLEALVHDSDDIQVALDILDRALLASDISHPMYRLGVRSLRRWSRAFELLPASLIPIRSQDIQLESDMPRFGTAHSDVFRGIYDGRMVAVKVKRIPTLDPSDAHAVQQWRNEVVIWRHLRHPNIVTFLGVSDKSPLCLVSDWMSEGTLNDFFRRHPSEQRTSYILGTVRGLAFMHSLGVVHGNIKPVNILVDEHHNARLSGFGLAHYYDMTAEAPDTMLGDGGRGTFRYMAPESFEDVSMANTEITDIYALAITIWEMFTSSVPFAHIAADYAIALRVIQGVRPAKPVNCEDIGFTEGLWDVIVQGWSQEPASRPPLSAFIEALGLQG